MVGDICFGRGRLSRQKMAMVSNWRLVRNCFYWLREFGPHFALACGIDDPKVKDEKNNECNDGPSLEHDRTFN
jgi:hypothetical protein